MRYLGLDYGTTYTGIAIGDDDSRMALPYDTIRETDLYTLVEDVLQIISEETIDAIVVGLPLTANGASKEQVAITIDFISRLQTKTDIQIITEDERFSSQLAARQKAEYPDGKYDEHALAATSILQTYLDKNHDL